MRPASAPAADLDTLAYGSVSRNPEHIENQKPSAIREGGLFAAMASAVAVPVGAVVVGSPVDPEEPYRLDSGDRLRIIVFGQDGLSNSYLVDSSGVITMPLVKAITARGLTTNELASAIGERLRRGFIREPHVAVEVDAYRPFFILGEVVFPGQYAFVPHMTIAKAVAIAGGFSPRAYRFDFKLDRPLSGGVVRNIVPPHTRVLPGDTIIVSERWF